MAGTILIGAKGRQVIGGEGRTRNSVKRDSLSLTKEQLKELFSDRENNRSKIIRAMSLYAYRIARQMSHDNSFIDDYYQATLVAINESIDKYNPDLGVAFHTFCNFKIYNEIFDLKKKLGIGHGSHNYNKVSKFLRTYTDKDTSPDEAKELYEKMFHQFKYKPPLKVFQYCMAPTKIYTSLNNPIGYGDGEEEKINFIPLNDEMYNSIDVVTFWSELEIILKRVCGIRWKKYYFAFAKTLKYDNYLCADAPVASERLRQLFFTTKDIIKKYPYLKTISALGLPKVVDFSNDVVENVRTKTIINKIQSPVIIPLEKTTKIRGYKNYLISDQGHVYSNSGNKKKMVKPRKHRDGRIIIVLWKKNKRKCFYLHRLVAQFHIENPNNYPDVLFKNGNKTDCRADNIYWGKQPANIPTWSINTPAKGETCVFCDKLTEEKVIAIYQSQSPLPELAKEYNISRSFVSLIKNGKRWKWLTKNLISEKIAV